MTLEGNNFEGGMLEGTKNFRNESMLRKQNAKDGYSFILKFCLGITLDKFEFPGTVEG